MARLRSGQRGSDGSVVVVLLVVVVVEVVVLDVVVEEDVVVDTVVSVEVEVVIELDDVDAIEVVVLPAQGHCRASDWPTTLFRHRNASVGLIVFERLTSQTQAGSQTSFPTEARRMNRQSEAVGNAPSLTG
jgi:hypothetical protein